MVWKYGQRGHGQAEEGTRNRQPKNQDHVRHPVIGR